MIAQTLSWPCAAGRIPALALAMLTTLAFWLAPAHAGEGHDHGEAPATEAASQALPRFSAVSEDFELVGVLAGRQLTLYLDRAATNEPVREAAIELDIGGRVVQASPAPEGTFVASLPEALPEGSTPVTATVTAAGQSDLLAGDIDIHAAATGDEGHSHLSGWRRAGAWGLGALLIAGVLALLWRKRSMRSSRMGGAA